MLGVCTALGFAFSSVYILRGGDLSINFRGCLSQQLNALLEYLSRINCFKVGRFSTVGAHGMTDGTGGGMSRRGQAHGELVVGTPELEHFVGLISHNIATSVFSCDPT